MDPIYGIADQAGEAPPSAPTSASNELAEPRASARSAERFDQAAYTSFANPAGLLAIYGNRQTGELCTKPPSDPPPDGDWAKIPSMTREMHMDIAREFLQSRTPPEQEQLGRVIGPGPNWHILFWKKAEELGIGETWKKFRAHKITHFFAQALTEHGVPTRTVRVASSTRSQILSPKTPKAVVRATRPEVVLRRLATRAVARMSDRELRGIKLTLGEFIDALSED